MGHNDQSLRPKTYPVPLVTPEGNYYRSIIPRCPYLYNNAGDWEFYPFTPAINNAVMSVLFMNGRPIKMDTQKVYALGAPLEYQSGQILFLSPQRLGGTLVNTSQVHLTPEEQLVGVTVTGGVPIKGYLTFMLMAIDLGHHDEQPTMFIAANSNSGVMAGPMTYLDLVDDNSYVQRAPCILHEPDYTQAMRDAGDIITWSFSPFPGVTVTQIWEICGLFVEVSLGA